MKGYILAGGRSTRMGSDKARLWCHGWPMAAWLAEVMREAGLVPTIVRRGSPDGLPWVGPSGPIRVLCEPERASTHPLWGVVAAIDDAHEPNVFVVPCDLPWLDAETVRLMVQFGPGVARGGDRWHALPAVIPSEMRDRAYALAVENGSVRALVDQLPRVDVGAGPLRNANRPSDRPPRRWCDLWRCVPEGAARARMEEGERARQEARGIVDRLSCGHEEGG